MSHVYGDHILSCLRLSHTLVHVHLPSLTLSFHHHHTCRQATTPFSHQVLIKPFISKISLIPLSLTHTQTQVMAGKNFLCSIEEMDRLWFHQLILFSEPTASVLSLSSPPDGEKSVPMSESVSCSSSTPSSPPPPDEEISTDESPSEKRLSSESIFVILQV